MLDATTDEVLDLPVNLSGPVDLLLLDQLALEKEMFDGGMERFLRAEAKAEKRGEHGVGGRFLLRRLHGDLVVALESFRLHARKTPGPRNTALALIGDLESEVLAYIALRVTLMNIATNKAGVSLQALAYRIGEATEIELWTREFKRKNPELFRVTEAEMSKHSADRQRHVIARKMARKAGVNPGEWSKRELVLLGTKLVDLIREATGLIRLELTRASTKDALYRVTLSEAAEEKVKAVAETAATMFPYYMPCIIPPKPWTSNSNGGYHGPLLRRHRLVKSRVKEVTQAVPRLTEVLAAVNAVQETPWRINVPVLNALRACYETEKAVAGLSAREEEIPPFPEGAEKDEALKKEWKKAAAQTHDRNRRAKGRRLQIATAIRLAEKFQERPAIWFPHQMDFRGRIYPIPTGLTHNLRLRWMSDEEEALLLHLFRQWGRDDAAEVVEVLVDTGMRPSELYALKSGDVDVKSDLSGGTIRIWQARLGSSEKVQKRTKNGDMRVVPMTRRVARVVAGRVKSSGPEDFIFPYDVFWLRQPWDRARAVMKLTGDPNFVPYICRHTCASRLVQRGVSIPVIQKWMGHKTIQVTMRYANVSPDNLADACAAMNGEAA